jgi:hypothetical protein
MIRPFGAVFLAGGLFFFYLVLVDQVFGALGVVVPCTLVGVVMTFGRFQIMLDEAQLCVIHRVGVVVPLLPWRSFLLREYSSIWIRFQQGDDSESNGYLVGLSRSTGEQAVLSCSDLLEARRFSERLSNCMGLGINDEATLSGFREAGTMNEPLCERLKRQGVPSLGPAPPRLTVSRTSEHISVTLPKAPLNEQLGPVWPPLFGVFAALLLPLVRLLALNPVFQKSPTELLVINGICCLSVLLGIFPLRYLIVELGAIEIETTVVAAPRGITVSTRGPLGLRTHAMSSEVLESLGFGHRRNLSASFAVGPKRLLAIADDSVISLGVGCSHTEITWLMQAISHSLLLPMR